MLMADWCRISRKMISGQASSMSWGQQLESSAVKC